MLPEIMQSENNDDDDNDDNYAIYAHQINHYKWYQGLAATRNYMLVCWLLYVVLPMSAMFSASVWKHKKATYHFITATTCGFGALIISYFDVLYVCYTASHHIQGPALFVLGSMLAVLFLSGKNEQTSSI
jgi:hypothetical protein